MSEQTQQNDELETLRRVNGELLAKSSARKRRISELESANADLQSQVATANGHIHELSIGAPLKAMADEISTCPNEWMEAFGKTYRLQLENGELIIVSVADGKPVQREGKPVLFEREALKTLLLDEKQPQSKLFRAILIASKASGGSGPILKREPVAPKPSVTFGLR